MIELLPDFREHLAQDLMRSRHTVRGYVGDVRLCLEVIQGQLQRPVAPADLSVESLRQALAAIAVGPTARGRKISALRAFCGWLVQRGQLAVNVARQVEIPRSPETLPPVLDEHQAARLVSIPKETQAIRKRPRPTDEIIRMRDAAMLEILYAGCCRRSEMSSMRISRVHLEHNEARILVTGKGSKDRTVPVRGAAVAALRAYLARRSELRPRDPDALWIGERGKPLGAACVWQIVRRWSRRAGLQCWPHLLRHTGATHLARRGAEIPYLQRLLGHAKLHTTGRYITLAAVELGERVAARHPRAWGQDGELQHMLPVLPRLTPAELRELLHATALQMGRAPGAG